MNGGVWCLTGVFVLLSCSSALTASLEVKQLPQAGTVEQAALQQQKKTEHSQETVRRRQQENIGHPVLESDRAEVENRAVETTSAPPPDPDQQYLSALAAGWIQYERGNYAKATLLFEKAAGAAGRKTKNSSQLGLAYTMLQTGRDTEAMQLFRMLLRKGYKTKETGPALLEYLTSNGLLEEATEVLKLLPDHLQPEWRQKLSRLTFRQEMQHSLTKGDSVAVTALLAENRDSLDQCRDLELFYQAASYLEQKKRSRQAALLFAGLQKCRPKDVGWQLRLLPHLLRPLSNSNLRQALADLNRSNLSGPKLTELAKGLIWERLAALEADDSQYRPMVEYLHRLDPGDQKAKAAFAWHLYHQHAYRRAGQLFRELLEASPSDAENLLGLAYSLQKCGELEKAILIIESFKGPTGDKVDQLLTDLYASVGQQAYAAKNYSKAAYYLTAAWERDPSARKTEELLHWSTYKLDRPEGLRLFLYNSFNQEPTLNRAKVYLAILKETGDSAEEERFISRLGQSGIPELQQVAGDYYYAKWMPVTAAQTYDGPESCYAGCAKPTLDLLPFYRGRNGDDGTSRLDVMGIGTRLRLPATGGRLWELAATPMHLGNGNAPDKVYAGSYYRLLDNPNLHVQEEEETLDVLQLDMGLQLEGLPDWKLRLGTTPIGGEIDPRPTFSMEARGQEWRLQLSQQAVQDSRLSWIGQSDPYSNRHWGRVLKTGIRVQQSIALPTPWWFSLEGEYGYYWGDNVADNQLFAASVSGGRTDTWQGKSRVLGFFASVSSYQRNSNFFTFGHGGYYSPQQMLITGPFIRLTSSSCSRFWWDSHLSLGYSYRYTDSAPHYWNPSYLETDASPAGLLDVTGDYEAESSSQLSVDARVRAFFHLTGSWFLGGEAAINNSSEFMELGVTLFLRYRFGQGFSLGLPEREGDDFFMQF